MSIPTDFATVAAGAFSGLTDTDPPSVNAFSSLQASFPSEYSETVLWTSSKAEASDSSAATSKTASSNTVTSTSNELFSTPNTLASSTLPSQNIKPSVSASSSPTGTAATARGSTHGDTPSVSEEDQCNAVSCGSGLQAAIAVPVVVVVLLLIALFFFCARRKRMRQASEPVWEKQQHPGKKKKWSRHLRVSSFDAELLMGGWRSSSNSIRSRQTGSFRSESAQGSDHGHEASIHSVDEPAPPYRDAISIARLPRAARVTLPTSERILRPSSTAAAPPPYVAALGKTSRQSNLPATPRDPFADASTISSVDESPPFRYAPENEAQSPTSAQLTMSRQPSLLRSVNEASNSILTGSDAGSIREAPIGRNSTVMSGARTTDDVRGNADSKET